MSCLQKTCFSFPVPSWFLRVSRNTVHEALYEDLFCLVFVLISHLHVYRKVKMKGCKIWKTGWPGMLTSTTNPKISIAPNQVLCNLLIDWRSLSQPLMYRAENCLFVLFCYCWDLTVHLIRESIKELLPTVNLWSLFSSVCTTCGTRADKHRTILIPQRPNANFSPAVGACTCNGRVYCLNICRFFC